MSDYQELKGHRDLKVYQLAYILAMEVFQETRVFPKDERYSLTDLIRRSSRSVTANIAEGNKTASRLVSQVPPVGYSLTNSALAIRPCN
jgi:hypothetical protein